MTVSGIISSLLSAFSAISVPVWVQVVLWGMGLGGVAGLLAVVIYRLSKSRDGGVGVLGAKAWWSEGWKEKDNRLQRQATPDRVEDILLDDGQSGGTLRLGPGESTPESVALEKGQQDQ